jgi:hypothetical protein
MLTEQVVVLAGIIRAQHDCCEQDSYSPRLTAACINACVCAVAVAGDVDEGDHRRRLQGAGAGGVAPAGQLRSEARTRIYILSA